MLLAFASTVIFFDKRRGLTTAVYYQFWVRVR
jgi:hypothetical protein